MRIDYRTLLIVALFGLVVWQLAESRLVAGDEGDSARDLGMIAVTGTYGSGASCLYLIDSRTRHMTVYRMINGRRLELLAARNLRYDFMLDTLNDGSPEWLLPARLATSWQKFNQEWDRNPQSEPQPQGIQDDRTGEVIDVEFPPGGGGLVPTPPSPEGGGVSPRPSPTGAGGGR